MNSKIICNWLGIVDWPPDHYALLGLKPGEGDAASIERLVQERMARLRCFQLSHPEEATEGMNRVAQAFISLTEALSKPVPGAIQGTEAVAPAKSTFAALDSQKLKTTSQETKIDWQNTPPPVRAAKSLSGQEKAKPTTFDPAIVTEMTTSKQSTPELRDTQAKVEEIVQPVDPIFALAHESQEARRGLGTLPALIERINLTRKLMIAWNQAGKYMGNVGRKLTRPNEEIDLTRRLNKIFELTADFPKIVGHPGQPGYRVVAMARLEMTAQMFKMLDKNQRTDLARDWESGYRVLLYHRRYLRSQFKGLRRRGYLQLLFQAIRAALNDHPIWVWSAVFLVIGLCLFWFWRRM